MLKKRSRSISTISLYSISQALAILTLILFTAWLMGFFDLLIDKEPINRDEIIRLHPLVMTAALIYIHSNSKGLVLALFKLANQIEPIAIITLTNFIYFIVLVMPSERSKTLRSILIALMVVLVSIGSFISIYWHWKRGVEHLQSLHAFLGAFTCILAIFYLSVYLLHKIYPNLRSKCRFRSSFHLRPNRFALLILATVTSLSGLNQIVSISNTKFSYYTHSTDHLISNVIGLLMVLYILIIIYITIREDQDRMFFASIKQTKSFESNSKLYLKGTN